MVESIFPPSSNWYHSKIISTREDGSVAYGSQNHIFVMEAEPDGRMVPRIINAHKERVKSVAFCPTERCYEALDYILSSSDDGFVKVWNIHSPSHVIGHNSHSMPKDVAKVVCAVWSPYNPQYAVSVAENDTIVLWNTGSNTTTRFYFNKLKPSVVECSYHNEKIVGVGSKSGLVFIIQLTGKGEILHRLRGHDKEIQGLSWSPIFDVNEISAKCFLASSCQEKEIFIWKAEEGTCVSKISLPKASLLATGEHQPKWEPSTTFIPIFWGSPNHLYSSNKWGELICCDPELVMQTEESRSAAHKTKVKPPPNPWKLVHKIHTNAVLAIAGVPMKNKKENSKKDDWLDQDLNGGLQCIIKGFSTFGVGFYEPTTLPKQGLIWTIGKDQKLVAVGRDPRENPKYYFHTINGPAFVSEVLPIDPHVLAIGAGDGKIRRWNVTETSGEAQVFGQKINDRVYSLAWHPHKETVLGFGTSEGRVGMIDVFSLKHPTNFLTTHSGKVYRMFWGPNITEKATAVIDKKDLILYSVGGHKILWHHPKTLRSETLNISCDVPCKKYVDLAWRSDLTTLAVGSKKGYIYILKYPRLEMVCCVLATSKCVMSLTWHPIMTTLGQDCSSFRGFLTFASVDSENVVKVYNITEANSTHKMEQVSILKGHTGYIQFVSWNPHISGRVISCSADGSVRIWDVTTCTQLTKITLSNLVLPLFCVWSPIDPDVLVTGYAERTIISWRISRSNRLCPVLKVIKLEKGTNIRRSELLNGPESVPVDNRGFDGHAHANRGDVDVLSLAKRNEDQKSKKEDKMFKTVWNPDGNLFQTCYELLKADEMGTIPEHNFSFLKSADEFFAHIELEDQQFRSTNNPAFHYQLSVWKGDLNELVQEHINTGQLDDYLLSIAPFVSHRTWQRACEAYAKILAEKNQYRKAATYLLAIHRLSDAIDMLVNANLFLEAICIARCRVPDAYPLYPDLVRKYADWLADTGNSLKASECYIYLNEFTEAVAVLAKKNQPEHLSLAALASRRAGLPDLEAEYSYRALLICLETEKFELGARICSDHPSVKKLYLIFRTHQLLVKLDAKAVTLDTDFITHIKEITGVDVDPEIYASINFMYDRNNFYTTKKNMFVTMAHELILACCAPDKDTFLVHIIKALNSAAKYLCREKTQVPMVYQLISWLYPEGAASYLREDSIFWSEDENLTPKTISLRGFLCLGIADFMRYALNQNVRDVSDMGQFPILMEMLMDCALTEDAYIYFRDQVFIKLVEKRINDACKRKNEQKDNSALRKEAQAKNARAESLGACSKAAAREVEKANKVSEDEIIASEVEVMNKMKEKMREFEETRVCAPNPAVVYCLFREVLEAIQAKEFLTKVEKKYEEILVE